MERQAFFKDLISSYLEGALDREAVIARLGYRSLELGINTGSTKDLISQCDWALRHLGEWDTRTTEMELRYLWECLRNERVFDSDEVERIRMAPPESSVVVLGHGVSARVFPRTGYTGVVLCAKNTSLTARLDALLNSTDFRELLDWFEVRAAVLGGRPYFLVPAARLPRFFAELRLFLDLRFSEAFGGS